jgi:hypothetical protein
MHDKERETVVLVPAKSSNCGQWRLCGWALATFGAATATMATAFWGARTIPIGALAVLGATLIAAEHRDRVFGDETSVSGSIVVAMAAVAGFSRGPWLGGPMFCAALAGLYYPHVRTFAFSRVAINAASMSLAASAAASVFRILGPTERALDLNFVGAGALALLAFWLVNSTVLGIAVAIIQGRKWSAVSLELVRSDTVLLPFAMLGLVSGYLIEQTTLWIGWLTLLPTLLLVDVIVIRRSAGLLKGRVRSLSILLTGITALVLTSIREPRVTYTLVVVGILMIAGIVVVDRAASGFGYQTEIACLVCVAVLFHRSAPIFAPLAVGLVACVTLAILRWRTRSILDVTSAAALGALTVGYAGSLLPASLDRSVYGSLIIGLVGGLVALMGWHSVLGVSLITDVGRETWRSAVDMLRADVGLLVVAGLLGGLCGWAGRAIGIAGLTVSLCAMELGIAFVAIRRVPRPEPIQLGDTALEDVVRSALLDLPASRLPEDL